MDDKPTHRLLSDGSLVFPEGYDPADIEPLPEDFWNASEFAVEQARAARWGRFKIANDAALAGGADVPGIGRVDTDADSRAAIDWHFTTSLADPDGFSVEWTLADNTRVTVDAEGMKAIKLAVDQHAREVRAARDDFRDRLNASQTTLGISRVHDSL